MCINSVEMKDKIKFDMCRDISLAFSEKRGLSRDVVLVARTVFNRVNHSFTVNGNLNKAKTKLLPCGRPKKTV